jgi:hypothetical protein
MANLTRLASRKLGTRTFWSGEAADEPALARQSVAATAREDHRKTGQAARPTKMSQYRKLPANGGPAQLLPHSRLFGIIRALALEHSFA